MTTALRSRRKNVPASSSSAKQHSLSHANQNVPSTQTRRKAEKLLVESLKACYPEWQEEGLIKRPR